LPEIEKVKGIFSPISGVYDSMNTIMSMGMDIFWRIRLLNLMPKNGIILDIGSGTGKLVSLYNGKARIISIDITKEMLAHNKNIGNMIIGSGTQMPVKNESVDGVMSAFVLRNLPDTMEYFREGFRVLKAGGIMANLDAFPEERPLIKPWFSIYFYGFVPRIGRLISNGDSYSYLAESVKNFKRPEIIAKEMTDSGFKNVQIIRFKSPSAHLIYGYKI